MGEGKKREDEMSEIETAEAEAPRVWLCRAGSNGEREAYGLEHGLAGGGFVDVPDLSSADSREKVGDAVRLHYMSRHKTKIPSHVGQFNGMAHWTRVGA